MNLFHRHHWEERGRTFSPPYTAHFEMERVTIDLMEHALHGFTTIELRCTGCGTVRATVLLGKSEPT